MNRNIYDEYQKSPKVTNERKRILDIDEAEGKNQKEIARLEAAAKRIQIAKDAGDEAMAESLDEMEADEAAKRAAKRFKK